MLASGFGDLATNYLKTLSNTRVKGEIVRLSQELASGHKSDLRTVTGTQLASLSNIESALTRLDAYRFSASEAAMFVETAQLSLGQVQDLTTGLAPDLITAANAGVEPGISAIATQARSNLNAVVANLNVGIAGRAVFSGSATDGSALPSVSDILDQVSIAISGQTNAADVATAVDAWFGSGGGFEVNSYQGATDDLADFRLADGEGIGFGIRADDDRLRDVLKGFVLASLVAEDALSGSNRERAELLQLAGETLLSSQSGLSAIRSEVGETEAAIQDISTRNSAEVAALEIARSDLVSADPFKTATRLQSAETQLETIYAITARLSRLSLVNYL